MKYNIINKQLFTNDGRYIKTLNCPLEKQWNDLEEGFCKSCSKTVLNTSELSNKMILDELTKNRETCIKVDTNRLTFGNYDKEH